MKLFELGVMILLIYIPIWGIVNRICACVESCQEAKYGKKDEKKNIKVAGFM